MNKGMWIKNFSRCRNCDHFYISHTDTIDKNFSCEWIRPTNCDCKGFEPKNNLEFVEWKYERQLGNKIS